MTARSTAQSSNSVSHQASSPISASVATMLGQLPRRLARTQGTRPLARDGAGRAATGSNTAATLQRSRIAARRLYQPISADVISDRLR